MHVRDVLFLLLSHHLGDMRQRSSNAEDLQVSYMLLIYFVGNIMEATKGQSAFASRHCVRTIVELRFFMNNRVIIDAEKNEL